MGEFFCIIIFIIISMIDGIKQINKNEKKVKNNKKIAQTKGEVFYFDYNSKMRSLLDDKLIYKKLNKEGDICYYDCNTNKLIYNESKNKRMQHKKNIIEYAQIHNLKYFTMPYVYRTKEGKDNDYCLSEKVETTTLQPFQLGYIPIQGYGFVIRKAPAIDPNKLYNYDYKYDKTKWGKWYVISKEKYIEMSDKPVYEYKTIYNYILEEVIKEL